MSRPAGPPRRRAQPRSDDAERAYAIRAKKARASPLAPGRWGVVTHAIIQCISTHENEIAPAGARRVARAAAPARAPRRPAETTRSTKLARVESRLRLAPQADQ